MLNLNLPTDATDDPLFSDLVARIIRGAIVTHRPSDFYVFMIDHWFDHKWLQFSGKVVGAVGSWRRRLTVPPFVPNRIVSQRHFVLDEATGDYQSEGPGPHIHHCGPSVANLTRTIKNVAPNSALFWYSGDTAATGRGSLMSYIPVDNEHWPWFLAFTRSEDWHIARRKHIHEYEVRMFQEAGERALTAEIRT